MTITINGTTGIAGVDGSASTPAVQGTDTNTGIFFPAADTIAFGEGGAEAMRIDSSGNVGIGTSSVSVPSGKALEVYDATLPRIKLTNSTTGTTSTDGCEINVNGSDFNVTNRESGNTLFNVNGAERARITSDGDFLVGTTTVDGLGGFNPKVCVGSTTDGIAVQNIGSGYAGYVTEASAAHTYYAAYFLNSTPTGVGNISCTTTGTTYNTLSDYRLKENILPITGALFTVSQLKPCTYIWKIDGSTGQGFIAHELQAVVPECVTGEKDAVNSDGSINPQGVDTSFLVATLTAAIQELKAELDETKARLAALEAQ